MTHLSDKVCKPKKPHECRVCGERIDKGESCQMYRGVEEEGFYTLYFHCDCWGYSRDWDDGDWKMNPGDISREEVLSAEA